MKNLTIAIPDEVYRDARIRAAERGTSVSAMVRDYLMSLSDAEARRLANNAKRRALVATFPKGFKAGDRLTREELYDQAWKERHG